jgi:hypothetical protein
VLLKRIIPVAALALLGSCKSATAPFDPVGTMMFTFAGGMSGDWAADGAKGETAILRQTNSWAASRTGTNTVFAESAMPRSGTSHDWAQLTIRRRSAGTETLTADCVDNCSRLYIMFGAPNAGSTDMFLKECTMTVGTITISAITSNRVTGTFSGTGQCASFGGASSAWTVTNGTFDTPIVPI